MVEKDWTFLEVWKAQIRAQEATPDNHINPTQPIFQWGGLHKLDGLEKRFNDGDKVALFRAIRLCALHGLVIPGWAATEFISGFDRVWNFEVKTWDEAFGRPTKKGIHLNKERRDRELRLKIYKRVSEIKQSEPNTPIDVGLFERVGKEFGVSKTVAAGLYYEHIALVDAKPHHK